ncbi:extracellular solute-binding protein [Ketogulonicigenium vulgare]|uniref:Sugar ABC transporter, sugar-binding protein n=1 Tax=Ketogulonicigenium vulgare (strain WSH-001) TaxID=759362 RepID=F9Y3N2_KETVW|nr:extracellular solute-binding protein [Ketogulonicigenium vulgare]ADO42193.1 sugar ABC transporter, (sugar-binding protein) [Ketogulonicigenium vulgare Y25]AEM40396.1 Sugar ABC transporter, sugar-binding protein [Ketogulonicigenium vulgare WSH-001]ALJ80583.1 bicyclomycin resistance protein [Ketogulonicigenium vulgare]ANW33402.1 bicyclomycin resistance protein [Ketogulonicigenium vulgare]AOZ54109.1 sugar ABC transporter (sugar-binding protein) [Ketogulonicigenium vulgare]
MTPRLTKPVLGRSLTSAAALSLVAGAAFADTVRVTIPEYSANTMPYFQAAAADFMAANPDTTIELEMVPWASLQQKLVTDISGGVNSDLAVIGTRWILDYAELGVIEPLDSYITPDFAGRFFDVFLTPSIIDGTNYGLPIAASARAMFYNTDILAAAGYDAPPATWEEMLEVARAIRASNPDVIPFGLQGKSTETDVYFYYPMWSYGGEILTDGASGVNTEAGLTALTTYQTMINEGLTQPGVTDYARADIENLFKQGRSAFVITGPFLSNQLAEQAPDLNYGIGRVPAGTTTATYGVTDSIVMFANSDVKDEAWAFLDFLFTTDQRVKFDEAEGFLPVNVEEAAQPQFADNEDLKVFTELLANAQFAPLVGGWEEIADATITQLQSVYLGQTTPEAALAAIEASVNAILP